ALLRGYFFFFFFLAAACFSFLLKTSSTSFLILRSAVIAGFFFRMLQSPSCAANYAPPDGGLPAFSHCVGNLRGASKSAECSGTMRSGQKAIDLIQGLRCTIDSSLIADRLLLKMIQPT